MLSPEDLRSLKLNETIAREALTQAERRLADILETKKTIEQKASSLFSSYVTISLAVFAIGAAMLRENSFKGQAWPFFLAGAVFTLGAFAFVAALKGQTYGAMGSAPSIWLQSGVIDGPDAELSRQFAYLTSHLQERITISLQSNNQKFLALHIGMMLGVAGSIIFAVTLFLAFSSIV